jgi:3-hydroxyisobutyrate dehydrogenase-like beta-hydroxyacid dehydrogenase
MAKDLKYAVGLAKERGVELEAGSAALQTFNSAVDANFGEQDLSAIIRYVQAR